MIPNRPVMRDSPQLKEIQAKIRKATKGGKKAEEIRCADPKAG